MEHQRRLRLRLRSRNSHGHASQTCSRPSRSLRRSSTAAKNGRFVLAACNAGNGTTTAFRPSFRYLVIDVP